MSKVDFFCQDIYSVSRGLERQGVECAVIYGSLPPGTKLAMADKFNDPQDPCKVMKKADCVVHCCCPLRLALKFGHSLTRMHTQVLVATDAIGMGLNLNIRRIIFYSLSKLSLLEGGEREMDVISVSQALQIAGRAGRFNTQWETGHVTCFHQEEMKVSECQKLKINVTVLVFAVSFFFPDLQCLGT